MRRNNLAGANVGRNSHATIVRWQTDLNPVNVQSTIALSLTEGREHDADSTRLKKRNPSHTKFVLGAHPIIEHFIETMRIREIISTYMRER